MAEAGARTHVDVAGIEALAALRTGDLGVHDVLAPAMEVLDGLAAAVVVPAVPPAHQGHHHGIKVEPLRGQAVFVALGPFLVEASLQDARSHQLPQPVGDEVARRPGLLHEVREATGAQEGLAQQ